MDLVNNAARFLFTKKTWGLVFAALLMFAIHAPARADRPCSGGDDNFARPIAAILQPNASLFNSNARFEVALNPYNDLATDITIRHSLGDRQLFRAITRLKTSNPNSTVVGQLPVSEGLGFSIQVAEGGSGYTEICTYGFRFQQGIVSYRTLAARAETREGGVHAGDATAWKAVTMQSPVPIFGGTVLPSPPSNMAGTTPAVLPVVPLPKLTEPELTKVASAYEYALLAEAVYSGRTPITLDTRAGTIRWQQSDRQIQTFPGTNFGLGFKASTYWRRDSVSRKVVCAVVFAGTDLPDPVDWANNIRQAEGSLAAEYEQGAMYAAKVSSGACRTASKIVLVGHSLGGGIAQYAFAKTGGIHETWTFNSAGLSVMNVTKALEWMPYIGSARVSNLIAQAYDAADGKMLIGHEPASVTGVQLTTPLRVPVYGFRLPHLIDVISEGIGIQRDYCLAAGGCEGKEGAQLVSQTADAANARRTLSPRQAIYSSIGFSGDSRWLVSTDGFELRVSETSTLADHRILKTIRSQENTGSGGPFLGTRDGRKLFTGDDGLAVWDTSTWSPIYHVRYPITGSNLFDGHTVIDLSRDEKTLYGGSIDCVVRSIDPSNGKVNLETRVFSGKAFCGHAISVQGGLVASYELEKGGLEIKFTSLPTVSLGTWSLTASARTYSAKFSPDGAILALGLKDGNIELWDVHSRKMLRRVFFGDGPVMGVAFLSSGKQFIAGSLKANDLKIFDTATGNLLISFPYGSAPFSWTIAISPDGKWLAAAEGKNVHVWNLKKLGL